MEYLFPIIIFQLSFLIVVYGFASKDTDRNSFFGIRTFYTLKSDENWKYVHKKAARSMVIVGMTGIIISIAGFISPFFRTDMVFYITIGIYILVLVSLCFLKRP